MSKSDELREAIRDKITQATYDSGSITTREKAVNSATDSILDVIIANLSFTLPVPDRKEQRNLHFARKGANAAIGHMKRFLEQAKSKEAEIKK